MTSADDYCGDVVLTIPARTEYVSLVRSVVASAAKIHPNFGPHQIEDLRVAVSEATTNAIQSHQLVGTTDQIQITCSIAREQIEVVIYDHGKGFDPDALPSLPEPESPDRLNYESGMGIRLMRMLADDTEIFPSSSGTYVRLLFHVVGGK